MSTFIAFRIIMQIDTLSLQFIDYRPQRSCGQGYIFTPVCHSVHIGVCLRDPPQEEAPPPRKETPCQGDPPTRETPQKETLLPRRPPARKTPLLRRPPPRRRYPPEGDPSCQGDPPQKEVPPKGGPPGRRPPPRGIWSMSGRYASYWNAFLFINYFTNSFTDTTIRENSNNHPLFLVNSFLIFLFDILFRL